MTYEKKKDLTGKSADAINSCKNFNFKQRFGGIPSSIMKFSKQRKLMDLIDWDSSELGKVNGEAHARGGGWAKTLRYSIYNPDQARFIIKYYTKEGDKVLDPFMGRATRPLITLHLDREYVGYDTSTKAVELNERLIREKFSDKPTPVLIHGDGTELKEYADHENYFDAVFSCPPYYNLEKYSNEPGDLSWMSFEQFNERIDHLFKNVTRLVKRSNYRTLEFHPVIFTVGSIRQRDQGLLDMALNFQLTAEKHGLVLYDKVFTENITPSAGFTFRRNYCYSYVTKNYETTLVFMKW